MLGAVEARVEQLLARFVAGQRFERGLLGRVLEGQDIARELAVLRGFLRRRQLLLGQAGKRCRIANMERAGLGRGEQFLGECRLQRAEPLVHHLELGLLGRPAARPRREPSPCNRRRAAWPARD